MRARCAARPTTTSTTAALVVHAALACAACDAPKPPNDATIGRPASSHAATAPSGSAFAVASAATSSTASASSASGAPDEPWGPDDLAVGEAILIAGEPIARADNPSSRAIDYRMNWANELVVDAREPGEASLDYVDPSGKHLTRRLRVFADRCRAVPLHPAIVLDVGEHATLEIGAGAQVRALDAVPREPWVASAHAGRAPGEITVLAQHPGHGSVMLTKADGTLLLWDVFVGGACKEKGYVAVVPAIPPGVVGPKGDGTCVRRDGARERPAPCPERARLDALSNEALTPIACDWLASCGRTGNEGCCVACSSPWPLHVTRACALAALRADTCGAVARWVDAPACTAH